MGEQLALVGCSGLLLHAKKKLVISHGTKTHGDKKPNWKDSTMLQHSTEGKITIRSKNQWLSGLRVTMGMGGA